ncbi:ABC transporter substrate-binding protein [Alkalihalobacillus sp. 1P02AB]|uniref:ABC transporter substrate-binding protein n=1 Tax=Alkalihalobacillus sp. 1P02AB TaxID=3132260 RepID=UPI0039A5AFEA
MRTKWFIGSMLFLLFMLSACNSGETAGENEEVNSIESTETSEGSETVESEQTVTYLGEEYVLPAQIERIVVTGAMEAMEDFLVLDVQPIGAMTVGGAFPERFESITAQAEPIGEKTEPDLEKILELNPDIILASTKFPPEVVENLEKMAPTVKISHIATDWKDNLNFLATITGQQEQAETAIHDYEAQLEQSKENIQAVTEGKNVLSIRVRSGNLYVYPESVFLNPILYDDLELEVPAVVQAAQAQELISIEQLAEINPDFLFIQYADAENADVTNDVVEELKNNPILQNVPALKENQTFVNIIDPLSEGGPSWSRIEFLEKVQEHLVP